MITVKMFKGCVEEIKEEIQAVCDGIKASGDSFEFSKEDYEPCDVAFHASGPRGDIPISRAVIRVIKRHRGPRLVLESPVFRRHRELSFPDAYYRLSWNGFLRDEADYMNEDSPPDRWKEIEALQQIEVKPWETSDKGYILICLQKENDASLRGIDTYEWGAEMVRRIRRGTDGPIVVRLHPKAGEGKRALEIPDVTVSKNPDLYEDFKGARAVVTLTSLSAIEAICEGIRTVTTDPGSMAWNVADQAVENLRHPMTEFPRRAWLWDLAYTQWRLSEIRAGIPWQRLKRKYWPDD